MQMGCFKSVQERKHIVKRLTLMLILAACVAGIPVYAHHSFAAHYFEDQRVTIEGELVEFEYRSPHAWVHVMAKDEKGEMQRFAVEWSNPNGLGRQGVHADTLKPGQRVIVTGSPGRKAEERKMHMKAIERIDDGWKWPAPGRRR